MADMPAYQTKTIYAHATGIGEPLPVDVVRAVMLLRANAFASNYSGASLAVTDRLIDFLNAGLHPVIPPRDRSVPPAILRRSAIWQGRFAVLPKRR